MNHVSTFFMRPAVWQGVCLALALQVVPSSCDAAQGQASSAKPAAPAPALPVVPKAVFDLDSQTGKDPFFPDSTRRLRDSARTGTNHVIASHGLLSKLALKGISYSKDRRLALINHMTLAEGEKFEFKIDSQKLMVRCLEIREHSVIVVSEGSKEVRELQLRKGL